MGSLALLYKVKQVAIPQPLNNLSVDFHINYWKLPQNGVYNRFVDFGIKVYNAKNIESILIYLPFNDSQLIKRIKDLGEIVSSSEFMSVLFNEDFEIHTNSSPCLYSYAMPSNRQEAQAFWIYSLSESNFTTHDFPHGTLLEIKILTCPHEIQNVPMNTGSEDNEQNDYNLYLRFRLNGINKGELFSKEAIANDVFQSFFSSTEMINLHINSMRDFESADYQLMKSSYLFFNINKFHFYFMGSLVDESIYGGTPYKDCSLLETLVWKKYLGDGITCPDSIIAYHWKFENINNGYHVFCRSVFKDTNKCKIVMYIFVVVLMGIFASYIANLIPTLEAEHPCIEQVNDVTQSKLSTND